MQTKIEFLTTLAAFLPGAALCLAWFIYFFAGLRCLRGVRRVQLFS